MDKVTIQEITFGADLKWLCLERAVARTHNSTFAIGRVSCSADSFVVTESSVLRINIYSENRQFRQDRNCFYK
jgi:hypothetical protein